MVFYRFVWKITRFFSRFFNRVLFFNEGGDLHLSKHRYLVIANHTSNYDPVILGVTFYKPIIFIAKEELYKNPFLNWFLNGVQAHPARRNSSDMEAAKIALKVLREGKALGVFPEGTRSEDGEFKPKLLRPGFIKIALKTGAWVQPVGISGTHEAFPKQNRFPNRGRIIVCIGKPLDVKAILNSLPTELSEKEKHLFLVELCSKEIQRLTDKAGKIKNHGLKRGKF